MNVKVISFICLIVFLVIPTIFYLHFLTTSQEKSIEINVESALLVDMRAKAGFLEENFDQNTKGEISHGELRYVEGKEGSGIVHVYRDNPEGGKIRANVLTYDNSNGKYVYPSSGIVEFWVKPLGDIISDNNTHSFFEAYAFRLYHWSILVYKSQLVVSRTFVPCIRAENRVNFHFEEERWYKLTLTWRGETTKFYINGEEVGEFKTGSVDLFPPYEDFLAFGDDLFVMDNVRVISETLIPVSEMTTEATKNLICQNSRQLLEENMQEIYKGIKIHNSPNPEITNKLKSMIDLMSQEIISSIGHILFIEDERYELIMGSTAKASFHLPLEKSMFLKKSHFNSIEKLDIMAKSFFHEVGHAYIYELGINYGGPSGENKRKEWAEISGIDSYVGECSRPADFNLKSGFLTAYGSTMADEDLAEWVGVTYDLYSKGETFSDLLNPESFKYNEKIKKKIDFLLSKGFITKEIYDLVTKIKKNRKFYLQFNE